MDYALLIQKKIIKLIWDEVVEDDGYELALEH